MELVYSKLREIVEEAVGEVGNRPYKAKGEDGRRMKKYNSKTQRYLTMLTNTILWKDGEQHDKVFNVSEEVKE